MSSRIPFATEEWYHCFNRGIDKRIVFTDARDYNRFIQLLYLCNSDKVLHRSDLKNPTMEDVLSLVRGAPLVGIGSFCLMPNHFHLLLKERVHGGISTFMQKLGTAYTMYFNIKNERTGSIFMRPFRSRHVDEDNYFQHVIHYIHCNPAELYERGWKKGLVANMRTVEKKIRAYPYSSLRAHQDEKQLLRNILDPEVFDIAETVSIKDMLEEAGAYYREINHVKATP